MTKPRVLIADDHQILVASLKILLGAHCEIVGTANDGQSLIAKALELRPDLVIADIHMPQLNGLEACERLQNELPDTRVILLTVNEDTDTAEEAIRRGAFGYVLKKDAASELFKAVQSVAAGRLYISARIAQGPTSLFVARARRRTSAEPLTLRQREVLQLLAEGKSMKEAGDILQIAPRTIAFHKYAMMHQLGITRNSELVLYATRAGICGSPVRTR